MYCKFYNHNQIKINVTFLPGGEELDIAEKTHKLDLSQNIPLFINIATSSAKKHVQAIID